MTDDKADDTVTASRIVTRERIVAAPAHAIFAIVADPRRHCEIDGSGSVRDAIDAHGTIAQGAKFGMRMRMGLPYTMINEVVEYEPDRRVAWAPHMSLFGRELKFASGRVWRYELEPRDDGTTLVRESWDGTHEQLYPLLARTGQLDKVAKSLEETLSRLDRVVTGETS